MRVLTRELSFPERDGRSAAYENAYYLSAAGPRMIRVRIFEIGNDIYDNCLIAVSEDHGRSWSPDEPYTVSRRTPQGMVRWDWGTPVADSRTGRLVVLSTESLLPRDDTLDSLSTTFASYRVSEDQGKSWIFRDRIVQDGAGYSPEHPLERVWVGKNAIHFSNMPFFDSTGRLIASAQITRLNPDGTVFCPPGAYSYHETVVLVGSWAQGGRMSWQASDMVTMEPDVSTRGAIEGAVAEMPDGRFLMVMRGSNAGNTALPGRKWYVVSSDGCRSWSAPRPWGYTDGGLFHSPSSYSTIVKHSSGAYVWFGNICERNPEGNGPDYPLVAGLVDPRSMLLERGSLVEVDTWKPDDPAPVHLRNFTAYEERPSRDIVLRMTRLWVDGAGKMRGGAYAYRIAL